jgi:hypothetical protein
MAVDALSVLSWVCSMFGPGWNWHCTRLVLFLSVWINYSLSSALVKLLFACVDSTAVAVLRMCLVSHLGLLTTVPFVMVSMPMAATAQNTNQTVCLLALRRDLIQLSVLPIA